MIACYGDEGYSFWKLRFGLFWGGLELERGGIICCAIWAVSLLKKLCRRFSKVQKRKLKRKNYGQCGSIILDTTASNFISTILQRLYLGMISMRIAVSGLSYISATSDLLLCDDPLLMACSPTYETLHMAYHGHTQKNIFMILTQYLFIAFITYTDSVFTSTACPIRQAYHAAFSSLEAWENTTSKLWRC